MIQRIQTIWLFLTSTILFLLFVFPYLQFFDGVGIPNVLKVSGIYQIHGGQIAQTDAFVLQSIATVIVASFPLFIIFNYKNRRKQIKLVYLNALLIFILGSWLFLSAKNIMALNSQHFTITNIEIGTLLVPLGIIFIFLAAKGIRKDEKLVRSADRLR